MIHITLHDSSYHTPIHLFIHMHTIKQVDISQPILLTWHTSLSS